MDANASIKSKVINFVGVKIFDHVGFEVAMAVRRRPMDIEPKYNETKRAPVSTVTPTGAMFAKVAIQSPIICSMPAYMK